MGDQNLMGESIIANQLESNHLEDNYLLLIDKAALIYDFFADKLISVQTVAVSCDGCKSGAIDRVCLIKPKGEKKYD